MALVRNRGIADAGSVLVVGIVVVGVLALTLPVLTGLGDLRRGNPFPHCVLAGLLFPVTWTVWYVLDERPYQRRQGQR